MDTAHPVSAYLGKVETQSRRIAELRADQQKRFTSLLKSICKSKSERDVLAEEHRKGPAMLMRKQCEKYKAESEVLFRAAVETLRQLLPADSRQVQHVESGITQLQDAHVRLLELFARDEIRSDTISDHATLMHAVRHAWREVADTLPAEARADVNGEPKTLAEAEQYVTLDQAAAIVSRSKKTLVRRLNAKDSTMPRPDVEGGGGKADEWKWSSIRPWLEKEFGKQLPGIFPSRR